MVTQKTNSTSFFQPQTVPNSTASPQKGNFRAMLEKHYTERGQMTHNTDNLSEFDKTKNNNWNFDNLESLKSMDQAYYAQGAKKKTLAETYTKRYGNDADERVKKFKGLIEIKAQKYGLDPNLLAGLVRQESNFNPYAVSHCGAMGLGQLMPDTARALGVVDPFNASQNLDGAAKYLKQMLDKFGGNTDKALAAYNAGPGAVQKHKGVPPFQETQHYVKSVQNHKANIEKDKIFG